MLAARLTRGALLVFACVGGAACQGGAGSPGKPPDWLCAQPIPQSDQLLLQFRFDSEWATTSELWGQAIGNAGTRIGKQDVGQFPSGRVFSVTGDGTVYLASFQPYEPALGERVNHHMIHGVHVVETIFNSDNNGWSRGVEHRFESVEASGERLALLGVKDADGNSISERLEVDAGGIVAATSQGVLEALTLYRIDPSPSSSAPAGTKRRFFYDTYSPEPGRAIGVEQLPARGICIPKSVKGS